MEKMVSWKGLKTRFEGKKVLVTGHTGFKGSWLIQILNQLGASIKGFALPPTSSQDLYTRIQGDQLCYSSIMGDIRDAKKLQGELIRFEPDLVFHLAAQSLVRSSYEDPVETYMVNTQGTVHVLEAIRQLPKPCIGIMVTTDKVYENPESGKPFQEDDRLGGLDPYSASKAAAEIVIASYRQAFFPEARISSHGKKIASARAGNVIGGGDYADHRLIPDIIRALEFGEKVRIRQPESVRPWQHVLEPLFGYLQLAALLLDARDPMAGAYNFGPDHTDQVKVIELAEIFLRAFDQAGHYEIMDTDVHYPESKLLNLDSQKAAQDLGWTPRLTTREAIEWTAEWYADRESSERERCIRQIEKYARHETAV